MAFNDSDFDPRWFGAYISHTEWHFHRQLLSRYGLVLAAGQFSRIVRDIRRGRARLIKAGDGKAGIFCVRVKGAGSVYVLAVDGVPRTAWPLGAAKRLVEKTTMIKTPTLP